MSAVNTASLGRGQTDPNEWRGGMEYGCHIPGRIPHTRVPQALHYKTAPLAWVALFRRFAE